jgi:putative acetyltransferase
MNGVERGEPGAAPKDVTEVRVATTAEDFEVGRALFRAYERSVRAAACFVGFERELEALAVRYAPPEGLLLLAFSDGAAAGCAGLRRLPAGAAEAKRFFVRPDARGRGMGVLLLARLVREARAAGYETLCLETQPGEMDLAIAMYRRAGFRETAPYVEAPVPGALYLRLALS